MSFIVLLCAFGGYHHASLATLPFTAFISANALLIGPACRHMCILAGETNSQRGLPLMEIDATDDSLPQNKYEFNPVSPFTAGGPESIKRVSRLRHQLHRNRLSVVASASLQASSVGDPGSALTPRSLHYTNANLKDDCLFEDDVVLMVETGAANVLNKRKAANLSKATIEQLLDLYKSLESFIGAMQRWQVRNSICRACKVKPSSAPFCFQSVGVSGALTTCRIVASCVQVSVSRWQVKMWKQQDAMHQQVGLRKRSVVHEPIFYESFTLHAGGTTLSTCTYIRLAYRPIINSQLKEQEKSRVLMQYYPSSCVSDFTENAHTK